MDPPAGKHSEFERRSSVRASVRLSAVGDDDADYDMPGAIIADGMLRPTNVSSRRPSTDSRSINREEGSQGTGSTETDEGSSLRHPSPMASRPSSIAKPPQNRDSLTLRGDNPDVTPDPAALSRIVSAESESQNANVQPEDPYSGPSGPSHPYQMYPQRAINVETVSTTAQGGLHAPTHPYGLYPQTTTPADGVQPQNIPVGFPGVADGYQRRIGPEGEYVAGLVGPLGHTEELPPYSRYPDEAYARKEGGPGEENSAQAAPGANTEGGTPTGAPQQPQPQPQPQEQQRTQQQQPSAQTAENIEPIPGAGGIGLATRDPEYSSTSDLDSPRSRLSTRSFTSDESRHEINTAALAVVNEKDVPPPEKKTSKWQKKATKKVWGIVPYWAICLLIVALCVMGVILGAVIGTFLTKHQKGGPKPEELRNRNGFDVIELDILPADLPALEIGEWTLPPLIAAQAPSTCFNVTTQAQAWGCSIQGFGPYYMELQRQPGERPTCDYTLQLYAANDSFGGYSSKYAWGTTPPYTSEPKKLRLVEDPEEPGYGPAWWLEQAYTKSVILPEDRFPGPTGTTPARRRRRRRDTTDSDSAGNGDDKKDGDGKRKGNIPGPPMPFINPGSNGWLCEWPDVRMEFLIYPKSNNSLKFDPSKTFPTSFPTGTEFPIPSSTASGQGSVPTPYGFPDGDGDGDGGSGLGFDMPMMGPKMLPYHPKVIKIRERRIPSPDDTAICRLIKVKDKGQSHDPVLDVTTGRPIEVVIPEKEFDAHEMPGQEKRWVDATELFARDNPNAGLCACIWVVD